MQTVRRSATKAAQSVRSTAKQQRRYAHDAHDSAHHASQPSHESLGRGFYIAIGFVPASFVLYKLSGAGTDSKPYFTRLITSYDNWRQTWAERNDFHTKALEQAAADRNLFINSRGSQHVELKYPETFNTGAPWNVPAGHGSANIEKVIAKYEKEAFEEQAKKLEQVKENKVPAEQPYTPPAGGKMQLM